MSDLVPRFHLTRVYADGTSEPPEIVRVGHVPLSTRSSRRGFLETVGLVGSGVCAAAISGCSDSSPPAVTSKKPNEQTSASKGSQKFDSGCATVVNAHTHTINAIAFSPDGQLIASASDDGTVKVWTIPEGSLVRTLRPSDDGAQAVRAVCFSRDSRLLASQVHSGRIDVWRMPEGKLQQTLQETFNGAGIIEFSNDGKTLASEAQDHAIHLWSIADSAIRTKIPSAHTGSITTLRFAAEDRVLLSTSLGDGLQIWNLVEDRPITPPIDSWNGGVRPVRIALSPGGERIAAFLGNDVRVWSIVDGRLETSIKIENYLYGSSLSFGGERFLACDAGREVRLFHLPNGELLSTLNTGDVGKLSFNADGTLLATAHDNSLTLWLAPTGGSLACLFDRNAVTADVQINQFAVRRGDRTITYTQACGSPIPAGATCVCNCVSGTIPRPPPLPSPDSDYNGGGSYCSCNKVCVCIPICQAHRLCDPDPLVRALAEYLVPLLARNDPHYLDWAESTAEEPVAERIRSFAQRKLPSRPPPISDCVRRLDDCDEVVAIMAAQTLAIYAMRHPLALRVEHENRIRDALERASELHWRKRARFGDSIASSPGDWRRIVE